ncbi:MAG: DUF4325 domain-containing protein [Deltaproteobacteria bacterium]|nr:DUF4325 domain-containing protein [Deltaproteobacteria bacterium]
MKTVAMKQFGVVLSGREFGKNAARTILEHEPPITLDFTGVVSVGSSFGDEVLSAVAAKQNKKIAILGASSMVRRSLEQSAMDHGVQAEFAAG